MKPRMDVENTAHVRNYGRCDLHGCREWRFRGSIESADLQLEVFHLPIRC